MSGEQLAGGGSRRGPKPSELPEVSFYERALAGLRNLPDTPPEQTETVSDKEAAQITTDAFGEKVAKVFKPQSKHTETESASDEPATHEQEPLDQNQENVSWWFTAKKSPGKSGAQEEQQQGWFTPRKKFEAPAQTRDSEQTENERSASDHLIERITSGITLEQPVTPKRPPLAVPQKKDRYRIRPDEKRTEAHQRRVLTITPGVFTAVPKDQRELTPPKTFLALPAEPTPDHVYDPLTSPYWRVLGSWRVQKAQRATSWTQRSLPPFDPLNAPLETLLGPTGNINDEPTPIGDAAQIATFTPYVPRHAKGSANPAESTETETEPTPTEPATVTQEAIPEQPSSPLPELVTPKARVRGARLQVVKAPPLAPAIASEKVTQQQQTAQASKASSSVPENTADNGAEAYPPVEIFRNNKLVPLDSSLLEQENTSEAAPERQPDTSAVAHVTRVLQRGAIRLALSSAVADKNTLIPIVAVTREEDTDRLVSAGRKVFSQTDTPEIVTVYSSTDRIPGASSTLSSLETVPPPPIPSFGSTSSSSFRSSQQPHYSQEEAATPYSQGPTEMPASGAFQLEQPFTPDPELVAEETAQNIVARKILLGRLATALSRFKNRKEAGDSEQSTGHSHSMAETQRSEPTITAISEPAERPEDIFASDIVEKVMETETPLTIKLARKALFGAGLVAAAVFATRRRGRR